MALETGTYISDLVSTNPTATDPKSQGDDHLRLIKSTIKTTFPNVSGAVTMTHTELNTVTAKGAIAGQVWTGTHDYTGCTLKAATQAVGDSSTKAASTEFVHLVAFNYTPIAWTIITADPGPAVAGGHYMCDTTLGGFTLTLPAAPAANDIVNIADYAGTFGTNNLTVGANGKKIMSLAADMTISSNNVSITLTYIDATRGWAIT